MRHDFGFSIEINISLVTFIGMVLVWNSAFLLEESLCKQIEYNITKENGITVEASVIKSVNDITATGGKTTTVRYKADGDTYTKDISINGVKSGDKIDVTYHKNNPDVILKNSDEKVFMRTLGIGLTGIIAGLIAMKKGHRMEGEFRNGTYGNKGNNG